jgi:hypothetical protein
MRGIKTLGVCVLAAGLVLGALASSASAQRSRNTRPQNNQAQNDSGKLRSFRTKQYEVFTNLPDETAKPLAQHMDRVFTEYADRLRAFKAKDSKPVRLYLFDTVDNYLAALAAKGFNARNTGGVFFRTSNETALATFVEGQDRRRMIHTLQHEGFHQFAHQRIGDTMPQWANEGLAEYFGEGLMIDRTIETNSVFPFGEMLTMSNVEWNRRLSGGDQRAMLMYDQAWAMAHFLVHANRGKYAGPFEDYLAALAQGLQPEQAFERAFKTKDFKAFEKLWTEYMLNEIDPDALSTAEERLEFMGHGIGALHAQGVPIGSIGALQEDMKRRSFVLTMTSEHGSVTELSADDDDLFRAPPPDRGRGQSSISLVRPRDNSVPPGVIVKGLRATAELVWEQDANGDWIFDIVFY